jgi:hypothetical protein
MFSKNKRAQVGETMTWAVATVIIVVIILISVYLSSILKTASGNTKMISVASTSDIFAEKSLAAFLITKDSSGTSVYNQIKGEGKMNDFNGNLASNIFDKLFGSYYNHVVFFGILDYSKSKTLAQMNSYFREDLTARGSSASATPLAFYHLIYLNGNKMLRLYLWHTAS